ncbi:MAG: hypothetical protein KY428_11345 [Bacteroidetes bacterium]|nr:hypothetical protein [Bacteroidota bacterium]
MKLGIDPAFQEFTTNYIDALDILDAFEGDRVLVGNSEVTVTVTEPVSEEDRIKLVEMGWVFDEQGTMWRLAL